MLPWRTIFFAVNSAACLGWLAIVAAWLGDHSAGSLGMLGLTIGVVMMSPALVVGMGEWALYMRSKRVLEPLLGIVAVIVGALACLGFLANVGEAIVEGRTAPLTFWLTFGLTSLAVAAYGFWCGWLRIRRQTCREPRGFSVANPITPR